ncbi:MAG: fibronectin type III-like domain-contianing protein, partial [Pseudomonadales bacterium]|nr:fibronectin type III-like domain-contianing protein [Pseudomonadales bacterium]
LAWYPGMMGGHALARLLFGEVNPSGKLPFSIPADVQDLPPFEPVASFVDYGYFHGYRLLDKNKKTAAYCFGHGLSYSRFEFSELRLQQQGKAWKVSVSVANTGEYDGGVVVQLYLGSDTVESFLPHKILRRFSKHFLEAGESSLVEFDLEEQDFHVYDATARQWQLEAGHYSIYVGESSEDAEQRVLELEIGRSEVAE